MAEDRPEWFAPKRYGFGTGLPIAWQGWMVLIGYVAMVLAATPLAPQSLAGYLSVVAILSVVFIVIVARTTRGGLRRRWGDDD